MSLKADADTRGRTSWRCAPLPVDLLSTLHACCPNIKAIHLWFLPTAGSDRTQLPDGQLRYAKSDLAAFSGLEELTLDSMFGDLPWWWSQVVRVLANSPRLRGLHLSIGHGALFSCAGDGRRDQFEGFLDRLCDEYSVEAAAPLRLRSLHLGHAVVPSRPGALARLTDLACLEDGRLRQQLRRLGRRLRRVRDLRRAREPGPHHPRRLARLWAALVSAPRTV